MLQVKILYFLRVICLIVNILIMSYFVSTLGFALSKHTTESEDSFTFYNEYDMAQYSESETLIRIIYFAVTTLTTIGFGDFNPKSEVERIYTVLVVLLGVCCFSIFMNNLLDIVVEYRKVTAEF